VELVCGEQEAGLPGLQLLAGRHGEDLLPNERRVGGAPASAPVPSSSRSSSPLGGDGHGDGDDGGCGK
jgi:hypothetical protein